ncbi:MAG: DUF4249 domain-containing protein [Bacteroidales bacterium]|nr:DUF4249 domain-containing protein [Bacteroidales bacterium]
MNKFFLFISILGLTLNTCIDPYVLNLNEYESLLVVDGLITDEPVPYTIKLSRTFQDQDTLPTMVSNAEVSVKDDKGNITIFNEEEKGIYRTNPGNLIGKIGKTYTLHIKTNDGLEYESEPCLMTEVPGIDSIYYAPDKEFFNNGTEEESGIRILIDSGNETTDCKYYRWEFEEVWKFKVPYPVGYKFIGGEQLISIPVENHIGWKYSNSTEVLIHSSELQLTDQVNKQALKFIASAKSDRLSQQYSILVKQYSLSETEYAYWKSLKQVSESGGDIFEKQPYFITGNIHSQNNKNEKILGFFQVSAVKQKRKYITRKELIDYDLPYYRYPCALIKMGPIDYEDPEGQSMGPLPTFQEIYDDYTGIGYIFVYGEYFGLALERLVFTTKRCSDCRETGDPEKPGFWVDLR